MASHIETSPSSSNTSSGTIVNSSTLPSLKCLCGDDHSLNFRYHFFSRVNYKGHAGMILKVYCHFNGALLMNTFYRHQQGKMKDVKPTTRDDTKESPSKVSTPQLQFNLDL
ncbi:hypothetical protein CJ030_MR8G026852 [Morella rubra]|uniref:Uncharacterized protein n=1 Tax=Morella rubra TaxID=262757 RepID=A0A6A1UTW5_9ROSI|nr:hypothetical protein CJ030_MR8G026852 [Morella rubra]